MTLHFRPNALAALALTSFLAALPAAGAGTITVKVAGHSLKAEVAATDAEREKGLMFREKMGANEGMVFVFDEPGYHGMWMRNTLLPLSVAFIDKDGTILNILDMEPRTDDVHASAGPARYAIETNKGWFAAKKIKAGDKVTGLPKPR
jgi:uncharacterized protein